jgi:transposase-like protein
VAGRRIRGVRAVAHDGEVLDILVQPRRDKRAAERFLRKLLKALNPKFKSEGPDEPGLCG